MYPRLFSLSLTILLALSGSFSLAADLQDLGKDHQAITRVNNSVNLNEAFGLTRQEALTISKSPLDKRGGTHTHYQQALQGVPVWGERVIIGRDQSGKVTYVRGRLIRGLAQELTNVKPTLEADAVLNTMKATAQDRKIGMVKLQFSNESSELVIYLDDRQPKLSYAVSFFADAPSGGHPTRPTFIVDAHTGQIIFEYEGLTHVEGTSTGPGGNDKIGEYYYGNDFSALDVEVTGSTCTMTTQKTINLNTHNIKTVDLNHGTTGSTAYSFTCPENTHKSINGAYSPLNDAHYFGGVVFDMYKNWLGSSPLTTDLQMRVHYSINYENAFWNGSSMTFGDGYITFHPLVSLDVSAHEVSHGFTEQNSDLIYSGQSGGINEAFSDIAGEAAEYYSRVSNDFLVGADIFKSTGALRYMDDPTQDGRSIGHAKDYVSGMDVHYSSGVYNKAFYLLATTAGWNTQKAFTLFAEANRTTWMPTETFETAYEGLRTAAMTTLGYAADSQELKDIAAAFAGVGIPAPPVCDDISSSPLSNGETTTKFSGEAGTWKCFKINVVSPTATSGLDVVLRNTANGRNKRIGDADLYINLGTPLSVNPVVNPPSGNFDCGSYSSNSDESCSMTQPIEGLWYIGVYGWSAYPSVSLTASYATGDSEEPPPSSGEITLTAAVKGNGKFVNLTWSGAAGGNVDIHINLDPDPINTANDGSYKDNNWVSGNTYMICEENNTDNCSNPVTVN